MFKIRDGRDYFYQWDINREVLVSDPTVTEVHFCNRTDDCSLVVEVKEELITTAVSITKERYAEVPNILLQDTWKIKVYAYCGDCYTKVEDTFNVKPRSKPADYVYTETEVKTYSDLEKRLDEIEEKGFSDEVVNNAVNDYFDRNPIVVPEPDLTGYATEQYVKDAIDDIDIPETDLSNYYNKQEVDTKVANVKVDLTGYATEKYVDDAISNLDIPEADVDLSNYYTKQETYNKTEVDNLIDNVDVGDITVGISDDSQGNVTIKAVEGGGGSSSDVDLSDYYTRAEVDTLIPYVPKRVSELANDAGYLTEHQSLEDYATESYVDTLYNGANKAVAYNNYSDMVSDLTLLTNAVYKVGQNIMIVTIDVPDLWVSSVESSSMAYPYTSDAEFVAQLKEYGYVQVGYYKLSALETQKVDLTDYPTKTDISNAGYMKDTELYNRVQYASETEIDLNTLLMGYDMSTYKKVDIYAYANAITNIKRLYCSLFQGASVQFRTAATVTNSETNAYWIGDDCELGVFTPQGDKVYEVFSYWCPIKTYVVNMVMNLGA